MQKGLGVGGGGGCGANSAWYMLRMSMHGYATYEQRQFCIVTIQNYRCSYVAWQIRLSMADTDYLVDGKLWSGLC